MNKKSMSESDIRMKYIDPALQNAKWNLHTQIKTEYQFTDGKVIVRGNITSRGKQKKADYLLFYKPNLPLAIIEAKNNKHPLGSGMQQALEYGRVLKYSKMLDVPFVYSSNGDGFLEHDNLTGLERELSLEEFPTPEELWERYKKGTNIENKEQEELITEPYYFNPKITPRYYQRIAVNRTIEAIAKGQKRILLVMATGTGKTYTAFQIIHRLRKVEKVKKVLFLADRNILVDQTMDNDFKPFEKFMTKVVKKEIDSSYEVYLSLYHQLSGEDNFETFLQLKPNFFDLIIVDECHRGSAKDESLWRKILDYFNEATIIGMTATPKETKDTSNIDYFGEPIYTYSLKQGIDDGFLAPYKVIRVGFDKDLEGYRPEAGKIDVDGNVIEDIEYTVRDFDRTLIIDDRTKKVAERITEFLKKTNRFSKTIVFCIDIEHAERMRQALSNANSDLVKEDSRYVMRITGDNKEGKSQLDNFIDEESKYPTIVTTSKLMTTGVDCKTCKLIVLDNLFGKNGMTEFKQIIGRGTRIKEDYNKLYFTIMDFRNASVLFNDPKFDGEPVQIYNPKDNDPIIPPEDENQTTENSSYEFSNPENDMFIDDEIEENEKPKKFRVNDVIVKIISERIQYYDSDGKLITENLIDYSKKNILKEFLSLENFLNRWNSEQKKQAIIEELKEQGVLLEALKEISGNKNLDDFDLICHIAFDKPPLTKQERVNNIKKRGYLYKYSETAQKVLEKLLEKYQDEGINDFEDTKILSLKDFDEFESPLKIVKMFGNKDSYLKAVRELQNELYTS